MGQIILVAVISSRYDEIWYGLVGNAKSSWILNLLLAIQNVISFFGKSDIYIRSQLSVNNLRPQAKDKIGLTVKDKLLVQ